MNRSYRNRSSMDGIALDGIATFGPLSVGCLAFGDDPRVIRRAASLRSRGHRVSLLLVPSPDGAFERVEKDCFDEVVQITQVALLLSKLEEFDVLHLPFSSDPLVLAAASAPIPVVCDAGYRASEEGEAIDFSEMDPMQASLTNLVDGYVCASESVERTLGLLYRRRSAPEFLTCSANESGSGVCRGAFDRFYYDVMDRYHAGSGEQEPPPVYRSMAVTDILRLIVGGDRG